LLTNRQVFYADERVVPFDHPDSNHNACANALFSKVPIPQGNIHTIDPTLLEDLEELSDAYEQALIREFAMKDSARFPIFDLILLGIGPDGHTASLFPDHPLLLEADRWVAPITDSPKPPPKRITLTFPAINHAARVGFVATGKGKKEALKAALDSPDKEGSKLPATRVKPVYPGHTYSGLWTMKLVRGWSIPKHCLKIERNKSGFHFVSLSTCNVLDLPQTWPFLFVNYQGSLNN
jgi:6-phosphogluconolactonase